MHVIVIDSVTPENIRIDAIVITFWSVKNSAKDTDERERSVAERGAIDDC